MKRILLTGSGGFLGSHLKPYLAGEFTLFCPRSKELNLLDGNAVARYLSANKIEFIIHSAAAGVRIKPEDTLEQVALPNIKMFDNLAQSGLPLITFGSGAEYDKSRPIHKVKEESFGESLPQDPYGYSKYQISLKAEKMKNTLNLRIFGIYGTGENPTRVTTYILTQIIKNEPIILNQNVLFSFIFIEDFCKAVKYFLQNPPEEKVLNACSPQDITIADLALLAKDIFNSKVELRFKNEGMNKEYTADGSRFQTLLSADKNFKFTPYEAGLKKLYSRLKGELNA